MESSRYPLDFILKLLLRLCRSGIFATIFIITGCSTSNFLYVIPEARVTNTVIILPSIIPSITLTPYQPEIPTVTPSPTVPICKETQGSIIDENIPSEVLGQAIRTKIYLPPCYDPQDQDGYPSIIMMHGQNGVETQWIELGMTALADQLITNKEIAPVVIILPLFPVYLTNLWCTTLDILQHGMTNNCKYVHPD